MDFFLFLEPADKIWLCLYAFFCWVHWGTEFILGTLWPEPRWFNHDKGENKITKVQGISFIANTKNSTVTIPAASMVNINDTERKAKHDFGDYRKACNMLILNSCVQFKQKEIENMSWI